MICTIDADGQYEADEIARVVQPILDDKADFVSGSRRLGNEARELNARPEPVSWLSF